MTKSNIKNGSHDRGRFSARRKSEAVLRLLRGEDLDTLSKGARGSSPPPSRGGVTPSSTAAPPP